jgi:GxxExxY protein
MDENEISRHIVDAAIAVHRELGPGLLESVYEVVLAHELQKRGLEVQRQVVVPILYGELRFDEGFRADMIIGGLVIVELKSVGEITVAHRKQIQTYLRLSKLRLGLLLNFGAPLMKDGIVRAANGMPG